MFEVRWIQDALNELTTIWLQAGSETRQEITSAAHALELALQSDPFQDSESRGDTEFVCFAYPLGLSFEVDVERSTVYVLHVWRFRRRQIQAP